MKILHISYNLSSGGAERFLVDLCNELSNDKSNEVFLVAIVDDTIIGNDHYLQEVSENVKYICLNTKSGFNWKSFIRVFKIIRLLKPDIVHAHCNLLLLYIPVLLLQKPKYIHTLHTIATVSLQFSFLKLFNKFFYKNWVQAVNISEICQQSFEELYKLKNSVCISNGRTSISTTLELENIQDEINSIKNTPKDRVFVHVARFDKAKNQTMLFDTFVRLYKEQIPIQLLVIGAGHENNKYLEEKECEAIHILGEKKNIGDYLACADFFILSSSWEGLPMSLLEAMSIGVVSVCTPAGGIPDVVIDGVTGYLSPSFDKNDFYSTVKRALDEADKIDKNKIVTIYTKKYSMVECAKKYYAVYVELLD